MTTAKNGLRSAMALLALAIGCFGQTYLPGASVASGLTINAVWASGGAVTWTVQGVPAETRKLDTRGPTLAQVRQAAHHLTPGQLAPLSYTELARSVGVQIPADEADILKAIHDAGLPVYEFDKVDAYLYRQALKQGAQTRWVWKPARDSDFEAINSDTLWRDRAGIGFIHPAVYVQRLPIRVLAEMKAVLASIPEAVFLVSDYEVMKPDPFLAISTPKLLQSGKIWIVSQWDEPGFTEAEPTSVQISRR
jgi:hypothetical protein